MPRKQNRYTSTMNRRRSSSTKLIVAIAGVVASAAGAKGQGLVANPSFELGTQVSGSTGSYSQLIPGSSFAAAAGSLGSWTATSTSPQTSAAGSFFPVLGGPNWPAKVWDGNSVGFLQINGTGSVLMTQALNTKLESDTTYTFSFGYGRRTFSPRSVTAFIVYAGSRVIFSVSTTDENSGPTNYWYSPAANTYRYSSGSNNSNAGSPLRVEMSLTGKAGVITESFFDSVDLTSVLSASAIPSIQQGGIAPIFSTSNTIQPGSWVSIYGNNFIADPVSWKGDFPTSLGGVSVKINGKPAYIWYASRTQLNVQAPTDSASGAALVTVTTPQGVASGAVTLGAYGPSFSLLDGSHAAAIVVTPGKAGNSGGGYDIIGPGGSALGYATRPVKAGETLVLYGVGFGPTNPNVPSGLPFFGAAACLETPKITLGGVPAKVEFAGVVSAGLYQFNVVVPNTTSGDQPLQAIAGGLSTPPIAVVSVQ
ncbi:MAG: Peptidase flavivirus helicase [Bryobacterales bacterium]|nr:Peptidase flavivirus helicase [Bryobacterales bacterium]